MELTVLASSTTSLSKLATVLYKIQITVLVYFLLVIVGYIYIIYITTQPILLLLGMYRTVTKENLYQICIFYT